MGFFDYFNQSTLFTTAQAICLASKYGGIMLGVNGIVKDDLANVVIGGYFYFLGEKIYQSLKDSNSKRLSTLEERLKDKS